MKDFRYVVEKNNKQCLCRKNLPCPCPEYMLTGKCVCKVFTRRWDFLLMVEDVDCPICPDIYKMLIEIGKELNIPVHKIHLSFDRKKHSVFENPRMLEKIGWTNDLLLSLDIGDGKPIIPIPQVFLFLGKENKKWLYIADPILDEERKIWNDIKAILKKRILVAKMQKKEYYKEDLRDLIMDVLGGDENASMREG